MENSFIKTAFKIISRLIYNDELQTNLVLIDSKHEFLLRLNFYFIICETG